MSTDLFDDLARCWQKASGVPSVSIAVLRRGALLHAAGYGTGAPGTVYQAASLGKHFTAALALLLSASGEGPGLDFPIAALLPELPSSWGGITLNHLLSHTSGIPAAGYDALELERDYTDYEIVRGIASGGPLDFPPGAGWSYSNAGYVLAGIAIGRSAGIFYGDLLRDRIFEPLGMTTASVTPPDALPGYVRLEDAWTPAGFVSPSMNRLADGGLSLSVLDFARWEAALSSHWGAQVAEMFKEVVIDRGESCHYGLGWVLSGSDEGRIAEHDGCWQGFSSAMVRYLDEGSAAVVLANAADLDASGLAHRLADAARRQALTSDKQQ